MTILIDAFHQVSSSNRVNKITEFHQDDGQDQDGGEAYRNWSFAASFLYALSLITTVGKQLFGKV